MGVALGHPRRGQAAEARADQHDRIGGADRRDDVIDDRRQPQVRERRHPQVEPLLARHGVGLTDPADRRGRAVEDRRGLVSAQPQIGVMLGGSVNYAYRRAGQQFNSAYVQAWSQVSTRLVQDHNLSARLRDLMRRNEVLNFGAMARRDPVFPYYGVANHEDLAGTEISGPYNWIHMDNYGGWFTYEHPLWQLRRPGRAPGVLRHYSGVFYFVDVIRALPDSRMAERDPQKIIDRDRPAVMAVLQVLHLGMLFTPGINSEGKVVFNGSSGCPSWEKVAVSMLDEEGHSLGEEIQQNMEYVNKLYAWKVKSDSDAGWLSPEVYTSYRAEAGPPKKKRKVEFGAISVWIPCRSARRVPAERKQSTMTWSSSATWRRT